MLGFVSPETFAQSMALLIGGVIALGILFVIVIAAWTGISASLFEFRQRRSWAEWQAESRQPDGSAYPAFIEGVCKRCGRGDRRIYVPKSGEELCPRCYEHRFGETTSHTAVVDASDPEPEPLSRPTTTSA